MIEKLINFFSEVYQFTSVFIIVEDVVVDLIAGREMSKWILVQKYAEAYFNVP